MLQGHVSLCRLTPPPLAPLNFYAQHNLQNDLKERGEGMTGEAVPDRGAREKWMDGARGLAGADI